MDQTQQVIQNLGVEIANKAIENASLKAQIDTLQEELKRKNAEASADEH
nr:hypothetical protein LBZUJACN_LBZUJACN_CDS_0065 [Caudoviricetes sp.]CAI9751110.1 hypothetical protein MIHLRAQX_MIHLRAQX_CDS_0065 [Caudoviricetes sp.]